MSNPTRTSIKQSLQTILQGVAGVKTVYTNQPRQVPDALCPAIVIQIEKQHETVKTMGNPGRRKIKYEVTLYIQSIDANPNEQMSMQAWDDLLDAIDTALRQNKDLSGTVLASAWEYIDTDVYPPTLAGQGYAILLRAIKTFDVLVEIIA